MENIKYYVCNGCKSRLCHTSLEDINNTEKIMCDLYQKQEWKLLDLDDIMVGDIIQLYHNFKYGIVTSIDTPLKFDEKLHGNILKYKNAECIDKTNKFFVAEYQVLYWKSVLKNEIEYPKKLFTVVHINGSTPFTFPDSVIIDFIKNSLVRKIHDLLFEEYQIEFMYEEYCDKNEN